MLQCYFAALNAPFFARLYQEHTRTTEMVLLLSCIVPVDFVSRRREEEKGCVCSESFYKSALRLYLKVHNTKLHIPSRESDSERTQQHCISLQRISGHSSGTCRRAHDTETLGLWPCETAEAPGTPPTTPLGNGHEDSENPAEARSGPRWVNKKAFLAKA